MKVLSHFESKGNIELLSQATLGVFASQKTPTDIYPSAKQLFLSLCRIPLSLSGGWQAPLEKQLLQLAYPEMTASILYYSAKDLARITLSDHLNTLDMFGKLLLISAESKTPRATQSDVDKRDALLFTQTDKILFLHIEHGGRLEKYYNQLLDKDFPVFILDHQLNQKFFSRGSVVINNDNCDSLLT